MRRGAEIARHLFMALGAFLRADEFRARNLRRGNDTPTTVQALAGEEDDAKRKGDPGAPK